MPTPGPDSAPPILRPGSLSDLETLVHFNAAMARETEGKELDLERLAAGVRAVLEDPGPQPRAFYRVAERGGRPQGCLMVTREWSDWRNAWFWWIQSVYVVPEARRTGVLRVLYGSVLEEARGASDVAGVRLYVERENHGAQTAYERLGLHDSSYRMFEVDLILGS